MADEGINNMTQPDSVGNLLGDSHLGNLDNYSSSAFQSEPLQPQPSAPHQMMSSGSISSSNPLDDDFGFDSHITSSNTVNPSSNTTSSGSNTSAQSSSSYTPGELISNTYNPVDHDSNYNASRVQITTHDTGENFNLDNSNYGMSNSSPPPPPLSQHQQHHHLNEPSPKDDEVDSGDSDSDDYEKYDHDSLVRGQTVLNSKHSEDQQHSQDEYDDEDDDGESSLIEYNDIEDDEVDVVKDNDFVYSTSAIADSANAVDKFPDNVQAPRLSPLDSSLSPQTSPTLQAPFQSQIPSFGSSEANDVVTVSHSDEGNVVDSPSDSLITSTSDAGISSSPSVPVTSFDYNDPLKSSGVASSVEIAAHSGQLANDLATEVTGGDDGYVEVAGSEDDDDRFDQKRCEIPAHSSPSMSTPVVASVSPSFSQPKLPSPPISDPQLSVLDPDPYCTTIKHQQPSTFYNTQSTNENRFSSEPDSSSEPTVQTGPNFTEPKEAQPQSTLEGRTWLTH